MTDSSETTFTAVDGTDALAFVIIRPGETEGGVSLEAAAKGIDKPAAAYVLRHVADMWDPEGPPTELLADLERARSIAVALEQQLALATVLEVPRSGTGIPLQLRRSTAGGDRWAICDREGRRWDREGYFVYEAQNADEETRTDTRFPLDEALQLARQIAGDGAE
jgi:hypothetical protein